MDAAEIACCYIKKRKINNYGSLDAYSVPLLPTEIIIFTISSG